MLPLTASASTSANPAVTTVIVYVPALSISPLTPAVSTSDASASATVTLKPIFPTLLSLTL